MARGVSSDLRMQRMLGLGVGEPAVDDDDPRIVGGDDRHVVPVDQDHDIAPSCWCGPITDYVEPLSGARVWVHRRANDLPHYDKPIHEVGRLAQSVRAFYSKGDVMSEPGCAGDSHDFMDFIHALGGRPLMYCRRCGEVRPLELPAEAGRPAPLPPPNPSLISRV